ncbi:hypothetical protein [Phytohabitans kaempferiae]|uniref:Tetratricopeptide repeat protein n=1 Tax=Phytohabitans kaempferiae TaxID=1620943 RepID=A0ABV6MGN9_9ACTN
MLRVCGVPEDRRREWLAAWERAAASSMSEENRFYAASPRELGIHSAITTLESVGELPEYVDRDFDFQLRNAIAANVPDRGSFVVLVGGSSTGKTRSLYEAVYNLVPDWWLIHPTEARELLDLKNSPPSKTVFWLDELQRYLGSHPPLSFECVRALMRRGNIVVGTIWPDQYTAQMAARSPGADDNDDTRRLLRSATVISVPDTLSPGEMTLAHQAAAKDSRIRMALETRDAGLTQVLAGGPALVMAWEQSPTAYGRAMITAAADAHRLGVLSPLTEDLLAEAMFGYLRRAQRVRPREEWLDQALPHATRPLYGDVSALSPADAGRAGTLAGYTIADYLAQHLRRVRRTTPVPHDAWLALVAGVRGLADLRRLADGALARLRYRYAERALTRLADEYDDRAAAIELAELLVRQGRFERAVEVLRGWLATAPRDRTVGSHLSRTQELWQRVEDLRPAAHAGDQTARDRIDGILADGGVCDDLRAKAEAGDSVAEERLIEHLVERGHLRELRERADRGHQFAAEALADLYTAWGEVDLLTARADAGDEAAKLRLPKARMADDRASGAESEVAELRAAVDAGKPDAGEQLCALLFELRDEAQLSAEVEAGTDGAADRLLALYTAMESHPPEHLAQLRAFGLDADGEPFTPDPTPSTPPLERTLGWPTT